MARSTLLRFLLAGALALTGCVRAPDGKVHLQYSFWGSIRQQAQERVMASAFEASHPGIKIDLLPIGTHYTEKIQTLMVGDVPPDVIMTELTQCYEWSVRHVFLDLTDDMHALEKEGEVMPIPAETYGHGGHYFSIPINCHGWAMYCNLDALARAGLKMPPPGTSWEDILAMAPRLANRHGDPHAATAYALIMPRPVMLFWQCGADLFDDPYHPTRVTVNSPQAEQAIALLRRLEASGWVVPPAMENDQGTFQLFRDGAVAFFFAGRWYTPELLKTSFRWDVTAMPHGPVSGITTHGGSSLSVSVRSRHPAEAREFVRFYASRQGSILSIPAGRYAPIYRDLAYGTQFLDWRPPDGMRRFSETMEKGAARAILYAPGSTEVAAIFDSRMEQVLSSPQVPARKILAGLEDDLNRWLVRWRALYDQSGRGP